MISNLLRHTGKLAKFSLKPPPQHTFGPMGSQYIRISLASSKESIEERIHRLALMLGKKRIKGF